MSGHKPSAFGHVFASYLEKLFVVLVAIAAFAGLLRLGKLTDERKPELTREYLGKVLNAAVKIANAKKVAPGQPAQPELTKPIQLIYDNFEVPTKPPQRLTTQELTAQIEHLADATIWNQYFRNVNELKTTASTSDAGIKLANQLAKEDALARGQIASAHALIEAAVIHANDEEKSIWQQLADEKSSLHVVYEIVWYALLIVGVLACSYLLMIAFLALPFTSLDGEWSKRIEEILKSAVPSTVAHVAIAPLAAAAVIAGTVIAGTSYATVPGGISRDISRDTTVDNRKTTNEGDSFDYRTYPQTPPIIPHGISGEELNGAVNTITSNTRAHAETIDEHVGRTIEVMNGFDGNLARIGDQAAGTGILAQLASDSASRADMHASAAHEAAKLIRGQIDDDSTAIATEQSWQKQLQAHSLAQSASVDERTFWRRGFGFTLFKIGPAVGDALDERMLADAIPAQDQAKVRAALILMRHAEPKNRWRFESALREHGMPQPYIDRYMQTLLHLCALPRE